MSRLIDADTLKAEFTGNFHETWHYTGVRAIIDNAPTIDAVPVVRCKDCEHSSMSIFFGCVHCNYRNEDHLEYWFCADGERMFRGGV